MWRKLLDLLRKGAYKIGIFKELENLSDHKEIYVNEELYNFIDQWKALYRGYYKPWHHIEYRTVDGWKERTQETLNIAKVSANEMASLIFNEKCEISIGDDDNETSKYVDGVLKYNKFNKKFQDYLEYSFAMGGMVIKPYADNGQLKLSFVTADCFIPIRWENDTIHEAVFINETHKGKKKYTHLEWHTWEKHKVYGLVYTVTNELYESQNINDIGREVPIETLYPGLEKSVPMPSVEKPLFVYFKPNSANNIDTQSPLGISMFANALDTMKAIDTAFDSFHREFRLGKKRILVPEAMIRTVYDSNGQPQRYFDATDETYEAFSGDMDDKQMLDISVELRVDEHVAAINALLNLYAMQTGFSAGTFTFDGQSMKTATEVISEQSKTFKSKQSHEIIIGEALIELVEAILKLSDMYDLHKATKEQKIAVAFDDSIAEDKNAEIDKQVKLVLNGMQSKTRAIMEVQGVTEDEALLILKEIIKEEQMKSNRRERDELEQEGVLFGAREG